MTSVRRKKKKPRRNIRIDIRPGKRSSGTEWGKGRRAEGRAARGGQRAEGGGRWADGGRGRGAGGAAEGRQEGIERGGPVGALAEGGRGTGGGGAGRAGELGGRVGKKSEKKEGRRASQNPGLHFEETYNGETLPPNIYRETFAQVVKTPLPNNKQTGGTCVARRLPFRGARVHLSLPPPRPPARLDRLPMREEKERRRRRRRRRRRSESGQFSDRRGWDRSREDRVDR